MIKNCIFDFGNVLAEFDPDKLTAPYFADEVLRKKISEIVFDRLYWDKLDNGTITDEEVKQGIRSRVPDEYAELACVTYDNWIRNLTPVKGMQEAVRCMKEMGYNVYLISNISEGFSKTWHEVEWIRELFGFFDGLVFSGVIKLIKPGKEIFCHTLEKFELKPEECIFIDDNSANINGAETAGIRGVLFDGDAEKLMKILK